ncbi:RNA polymerase sigma factor [Alkaliphilus transvaalensis]|uniref:RNA polymerase sigma factor n=1 Tax=Alkaliphilus transvaalensis TaxID=114628 RepID=UPI00047CC3FC|nr:RNA polymerase sigma factor [Alkaliphilus transvaalensis]
MAEFEEIYCQYFDDVYKYTLSLCRDRNLADEITQEVFFKALKNIDKFKGNCKMRVWLCQIAKNTYFSLCQKNKQFIDNPYEEKESEHIERKLINKEVAWEIHKKLHYLGEPYKEVFSLRVFGELSFLQISELFGKTESWARVTFHRARLKIREDLE